MSQTVAEILVNALERIGVGPPESPPSPKVRPLSARVAVTSGLEPILPAAGVQ
jgi:hypothetical protein